MYTKIEIQTNTHIPKTPSSHPSVETQKLTHIYNAYLHENKMYARRMRSFFPEQECDLKCSYE